MRGRRGSPVRFQRVLQSFWQTRNATSVLPVPVAIAVAYIVFGAAAFVASRYEAFFVLVFLVPGLLLAVASTAQANGELSGRW